MDTIFTMLAHDHDMHDALFAQACGQVIGHDWPSAARSLAQLRSIIGRHLEAEETLVFAAYDQVVGSMAASTAILRAEHRQVAGVLERMIASLEQRDRSAFLKHAGTLRLVLQLHKEKEEHVFYPMAERLLGPVRERIHAALAADAASLRSS